MIFSTLVERQAKKHLRKTFINERNIYDYVISRADWPEFVRAATTRCNQMDLHYPEIIKGQHQLNEFIGRMVIKHATRHVDKAHDEYQEGTPDKPKLLSKDL